MAEVPYPEPFTPEENALMKRDNKERLADGLSHNKPTLLRYF